MTYFANFSNGQIVWVVAREFKFTKNETKEQNANMAILLAETTHGKGFNLWNYFSLAVKQNQHKLTY